MRNINKESHTHGVKSKTISVLQGPSTLQWVFRVMSQTFWVAAAVALPPACWCIQDSLKLGRKPQTEAGEWWK